MLQMHPYWIPSVEMKYFHHFLSLSYIVGFLRPYSFDKEVYDCSISSFSCLRHISSFFSIDTTFLLRFVLGIPATSELLVSNELDAMFVIFTYECRNNFWLSRRFGRWSIRLIDVRIKEVLLYSWLLTFIQVIMFPPSLSYLPLWLSTFMFGISKRWRMFDRFTLFSFTGWAISRIVSNQHITVVWNTDSWSNDTCSFWVCDRTLPQLVLVSSSYHASLQYFCFKIQWTTSVYSTL